MNIADYIGYGKESSITASELSDLLHIPTRKVRKMIEECRRSGIIIINDQDGKGYYKSDKKEDIERQMRQNHSRAMAILVQQKHLRRKLREYDEFQRSGAVGIGRNADRSEESDADCNSQSDS